MTTTPTAHPDTAGRRFPRRARGVGARRLTAPAQRPRIPASRRTDLTRTELHVLERVSDGLTNDEIAAELGIATCTVSSHLGAIHAKSGSANKPAAVAVGFARGLLRPRPLPPGTGPVPLEPGLAALLPLIAAGYSNTQIGRRTGLSVNGVKSRLARLYGILGTASRAHLVRLCVEHGLLPPGAGITAGAAA